MGRVASNLAHILPIRRHPPANTLSSDTWRPGEDRHSAAPEAVHPGSLQISRKEKTATNRILAGKRLVKHLGNLHFCFVYIFKFHSSSMKAL